jgi:hypothetical protein
MHVERKATLQEIAKNSKNPQIKGIKNLGIRETRGNCQLAVGRQSISYNRLYQ